MAAALGWQPLSKLLRIERGMVDISVMDLCVLLHHYDVTDASWVDELIALAGHARRDLYDQFRGVLPSDYLYYLQYESAASVFRSFEPSLVPGFLQTREYAENVFKARTPIDSDTGLEQKVELRMERQKLLSRPDGFRAVFIIDEAVLHHRIGGRDGMLRQLGHLRTMSTRPNVDLRVIPFGYGAHLGLWGSFVVLEFPSPNNNELVFVEHQAGVETIDGRAALAASYVERFWALEDCCAPPEEGGDIIDRAINQLAEGA
ncbi:hypothetical protein J2S43_007251 [Catenuloplanes nepalensis]|uniref:DUF5753 domain-containing protein n=1 Tax=Catenuloplanes nepalensis TaxID=587533 RepID=A0ABT9N4X7_9ACTN|nr:hypothetical protein [Catenuloplanes nepalensis]